jgi:hypothetical protein
MPVILCVFRAKWMAVIYSLYIMGGPGFIIIINVQIYESSLKVNVHC